MLSEWFISLFLNSSAALTYSLPLPSPNFPTSTFDILGAIESLNWRVEGANCLLTLSCLILLTSPKVLLLFWKVILLLLLSEENPFEPPPDLPPYELLGLVNCIFARAILVEGLLLLSNSLNPGFLNLIFFFSIT